MEYYFERYGDLDLHRRMIADRWRTEAFARAIREVVRAPAVVLDVGTGTGILAMLAARAGARKVVAIDQADIVKVAANLVRDNGLSHVVQVLKGPAGELELEEKADVLISEWLGNLAFVEGMLDDVLAARDRCLKPDGAILPSSAATLLAPLDDSVMYGSDGPGFWRRPVQGLDFASLEGRELAQGRAFQVRIEPAALLSDGQEIARVELAKATSNDPWTQGEIAFRMDRDGVLNGFAGWFNAQLSPSVVLDTGPGMPETHWAQTYFAFTPVPVRKGTMLPVRYELARDTSEPRHVRLALTVGDVRHDYRVE